MTLAFVLLVASSSVAVDEKPMRIEAFWQTGALFLSGPERVAAGLGGGPGARLQLGSWVVDAQASWFLFAGNSVSLSMRLSYALQWGVYQPSLGVTAGVVVGQSLRSFSTDHPEPPLGPPLFVQLGLSPLRFANERFSASVLEVRYGLATSRDEPATILTLNFIEVGLAL